VSEDGWDIGIVLGRATWPAEIPVHDIDAWIPGVDGEAPAELSPARAGDLDGDGMDELLVANPTDWWGSLESAGTVRVFRGRETWPPEIDRDDYDLLFVGSHTNQGMGNRPLFVVGDVDGDARDDVVSSSFYHPDDSATGATFVFLGQPAP
jgi:hypothetical protein